MNSEQLELLKNIQDLGLVDLSKLYWVIGVMFVMFGGQIVASLVFFVKLYGKAIEWKTTIERNIQENTKDVNQAHGKIRKLEERLMN